MAGKQLWVFYDSVAKIQSNPLSRDEAQSTILKIRPQSIERFFIWTQGWQNWQPLRNYLESDQKVFVSTFTVSRSNEETVKALAKEIFEQTATYNQTQTSFPHEDTQTATHTNTHTNTKTYSHINLREETISRFLKASDLDESLVDNFDASKLELNPEKKPKLDFSKIMKKMDTRAVRHELKIEILLISARGKTFRTLSKNISLTGVLLEDCMPYDFYDKEFEVVVISAINKDVKNSRVKLQAKAVVASGNYTQRVQFLNITAEQKEKLQQFLEDYLESAKQIKNQKKPA